MSDYTVAFSGMPSLLSDYQEVMQDFTYERYPDRFRAYCKKHETTLRSVENGYRLVIDKNQFLTNMAQEVARTAEEMILSCSKKQEREQCADRLNLCMVVYVIPAVLERKGTSSEPFSEKLLAVWKEHFPKTKLKISTYEQINDGFKRRFCYITSAVCRTLGKPDDCYELTLFRDFRDHYLLNREDGEELVREYYDLAPAIVEQIEHREDSDVIYRDVWETYLLPCMHLIERGENEACTDHYIAMVRQLQERYL